MHRLPSRAKHPSHLRGDTGIADAYLGAVTDVLRADDSVEILRGQAMALQEFLEEAPVRLVGHADQVLVGYAARRHLAHVGRPAGVGAEIRHAPQQGPFERRRRYPASSGFLAGTEVGVLGCQGRIIGQIEAIAEVVND